MIKRKLTPVHMSKVKIEGPFWAQRTKINRERTIPHLYDIFKERGQIDSFRLDWEPPKVIEPPFFGYYGFYKWVEAACYLLVTHPGSQLKSVYADAKLESILDELVELIAKRQSSDGYIPPISTVNGDLPATVVNAESGKRWTNLRDRQELFGSGHLFEAAVAHFEATGKRTLLDVACRHADHIDTVFGVEPGKKRGYPGHQEVELALMRLYKATGEKCYAKLAKYFIDEHGQQPHYFDREAIERGEDPTHFWAGTYEYNQSHKPIREQDKVLGQAGRATILFSGTADVVAEFGDEGLWVALVRLWDHLTSKRMYITGGIGSAERNEGFSEDYDLPNETANAETCHAINVVLWAHRMLQFDCDGRYADVMERSLYNGLISGVSLDGKQFFTHNPLESRGWWRRLRRLECPCCPPNLARLVASLGNYVYSESETDAVVHLYVGGTASLHIDGQTVGLHMDTQYPWDGKVVVTVEPETPASFGLKLRVPGWCNEFSLKVNGEEIKSLELQRGYLRVEREWKVGDSVELNLTMPIELVKAHPDVGEDSGCVAIQRGPIVYCIEQVDNNIPPYLDVPLENRKLENRVPLKYIILPADVKLEACFEQDLLDGVVVIYGDALHDSEWDNQLYRFVSGQRRPFKIKAIPYYAWCNRGRGEMRVWIRNDV